MSHEHKECHCTPRLRFPEFVGEKWQHFPANTFFSDAKEKNYGNLELPILAITQDSGAIPRADINYTVITSQKSIENYKIVRKGDFIISLRSFQGGIEYSKFDGLCSPAYIVLRKIDRHDYNDTFFTYYFKTERFISDLNKDLIGIRDGKIIPYTHFSKLILPLPCIKEQQKIADCLTSLDDLITAHEQKRDALTQYKKGLMQRLFPAEGETTPRWRFPEFREAGEWERYEVGDLFTVTRGEVLAMTEVKAKETDGFSYPVYSSQTKNNGLAGFYSKYLYEDAITWTTDGANAGDVNFRKGKFYCTNVCGVLLSNSGYANKCIAEIINSITKRHVSYVGNPKLMNNVMKKIEISIPSLPEQQKIADCLSSLDERIAAQEAKIAALREHKKGLMQQLFPRAL